MEMTLESLAIVKRLEEARAAAKAATAEAKSLSDQILALLGEDTEGTLAGVTVVKAITVTRTGVDVKAMREEVPEIYAQYQTSTTYRQVKI